MAHDGSSWRVARSGTWCMTTSARSALAVFESTLTPDEDVAGCTGTAGVNFCGAARRFIEERSLHPASSRVPCSPCADIPSDKIVPENATSKVRIIRNGRAIRLPLGAEMPRYDRCVVERRV